MFECRACLSRSFRAVAGHGLYARSTNRGHEPLLALSRPPPPFRRAASSAVAVRSERDEDVPAEPVANTGDVFDKAAAGKKKRTEKGLALSDTKALRTELQYLSDPLKLAQHVHYTLRCDKPVKALNLCRMASKQDQVIVSWNHCIDWHMSRNHVDEALRIYNEMKKRAQFPDSHTYILLLRGLAKPPCGDHQRVHQSNVTKALSIYTSMTGPTSRVKPSIYHTNATLKVCSNALDMDALWTVAAKLPSKGRGAPDHITYGILLNAIRHGAVGDNPLGAQEEQIAGRRQEAVNQGRRIWQEIIPKWRAGEVHIDEELVCAMGRLLLISRRLQDCDDVLNLVEQTMQVPRQIAPVGSLDRKTDHVPQELLAAESADEGPEDAEGYREAPSTKAFNPVTPQPAESSRSKGSHSLAYVQPGNSTLSMLIDACAQMRAPQSAHLYWNLLSGADGPYDVKVDRVNYHAILRLLGKNRASGRVVEVLKTMPEYIIDGKTATFRLAMRACMRDKNNHHALDHARTLIEEMLKHRSYPDAHTLLQYLELAMMSNDGARITSAIDYLEPIARDLDSRLRSDAEDKQAMHQRNPDESYLSNRQEAISVLKALVGAVDTLSNKQLVPESEADAWSSRRADITRAIESSRSEFERQVIEAKNRRQEQFEQNKVLVASSDPREREMRVRRANAMAVRQARRREIGAKRSVGVKPWDGGRNGGLGKGRPRKGHASENRETAGRHTTPRREQAPASAPGKELPSWKVKLSARLAAKRLRKWSVLSGSGRCGAEVVSAKVSEAKPAALPKGPN